MNLLEVQDVSLIPHQHKSTNDIDPVVIISPCILEFKDTIVNMNDGMFYKDVLLLTYVHFCFLYSEIIFRNDDYLMVIF